MAHDTLEADEQSAGPVDAAFSEPSASAEAERRTLLVFVRPPTPVAWSITAVNVAVFGLELFWGGSRSAPTLHRIGAGLGRAALADEPWRIVSAAFVHIAAPYLIINMTLLLFCRFLEVVLGASRFVVLYALSATAGGLASSLFHADDLTAGASGAVWGLATAQMALLMRLKRQGGAEGLPPGTPTRLQPLVVTLLFSLMPGMDLAAQLGGGIAGAGLILSGLMWGPRPAAGWRPAAWAASLAMAGCLGMALAHGRPWELRWPPPLVQRAIADTLVAVPVPDGLEPGPSEEEDVTVFGDPSRDPLVLYCEAGRHTPRPYRQRRTYLSKRARDFAARPLDGGWSWDVAPRVVQLRGRPAVFWVMRSKAGRRQMTWMMMDGSWWLRLDAVLHQDAAATWVRLPLAIAEGAAALPVAP